MWLKQAMLIEISMVAMPSNQIITGLNKIILTFDRLMMAKIDSMIKCRNLFKQS